MGILDFLTGKKNTERLEDFLRHMLRGLMSQDPNSNVPGYLNAVDLLSLKELISTIPATVMTIAEQHDQYLHQGMSSQEAVAFIDAQRQIALARLGYDNALSDAESPDSLDELILSVIRREYPDTGPFRIDKVVVAGLVGEVREFVKRNPKDTMTALRASRQARDLL